LTRKQIVQEDQIHSLLTLTYDWVSKNSKWLASGLGIAAVVWGGAYLWQYYSQSQGDELQRLFGDALEIYSAPLTKDQAPQNVTATRRFQTSEERAQQALEAFSKLAERSPRSEVGAYSRYYVALIQDQQGRKAEAKKALEALSGEDVNSMVRSLALHYLAQLAEQAKDHQSAVRLLNKLLADSAATLPKQTVLFRLGQNYEALGKVEEALKQYQKITSEFPNSEDSRQAQARLDQVRAARGTM
jgi:tetratricopeptide (TPR) repeat protein